MFYPFRLALARCQGCSAQSSYQHRFEVRILFSRPVVLAPAHALRDTNTLTVAASLVTLELMLKKLLLLKRDKFASG